MGGTASAELSGGAGDAFDAESASACCETGDSPDVTVIGTDVSSAVKEAAASAFSAEREEGALQPVITRHNRNREIQKRNVVMEGLRPIGDMLNPAVPGAWPAP